MKKKSILLTMSFILVLLLSIPGLAADSEYGNEWVYDEPSVISAETEEYIKNLNETIFSQYKNKPQLAIVMINDLPYDMDEYTLDLFNDYGIGTAEENCGMLFAIAINDRKYDFEIGDGFEENSLLRKDLETDFISAGMKVSLRAGDYDTVVFQVAQHLEGIMSDAENGVYAQKEAEKAATYGALADGIEAMSKAFTTVVQYITTAVVVFIPSIGIIFLAIYFGKKHFRKKKIIALSESYYKYFSISQITPDEFISYLNDKHEDLSINQLEEKLPEFLYTLYLDKQMSILDANPPVRANLSKYKAALRRTNDFNAFQNCRLTDLRTITYRVDSLEKQRANFAKSNGEFIDNFFRSNKHRIIHPETASMIYDHLKRYMCSDKLLTQDVIEAAFVSVLKEANFRWEVDQFLAEHADEAQGQYFDRNSFYHELSTSDNFSSYHYCEHYDRSWMYPLLVMHMGSKQKAHEKEISRRNAERAHREELRREEEREEERRREQERMDSYNSSFGSSFGGGHSSGGGFNGEW